MRDSLTDRVGKLLFVISLVVLAFFYGFAANTFEWFPNSILERAWQQAKAASPMDSPDYLMSRVYERDGVRIVDTDAIDPGLTLIATVWEEFGWTAGLKLIGTDGRILHKWKINPTALFSESDDRRPEKLKYRTVHGAHLLPNGDVVVNVDYTGTARLDACGRVLWKLPAGSHHSITRDQDGSFWIPGSSHEAPARAPGYPEGFPGLVRPVNHDLLLHVSEEGAILEKVNVLAVLYDNGLERFISKADQISSRDVTHVNDIEPLSTSLAEEYPLFQAGDLLVSARNIDLVFIVNPESRRVKWHAWEPFIRQHDPDFIGGGWIGIFDNNQDPTARGTMLGGSRIVALQPHTDSLKVLFPTPLSEPFYTSIMGKWQQLENGNLLLTESGAGRVVEVTPAGRTVWEWVHASYDESSVPEVTEAARYRLTSEEVGEWPCSPSQDQQDKGEETE